MDVLELKDFRQLLKTIKPLPLVVLIGPTAIGKSRIAIQVAKALGTEVLTADSTQVYRGMDIGTDKPTVEEQQEVPHHLINLVEPDEPFNVGEYRRYAISAIERLHRKGCIPLVVGGTGLYVRALLRGLWPGPLVNWSIRHQLTKEAAERGLEAMYQELRTVDSITACHLHPHDSVKVLRAIEVYRQTGFPLSQAHQRHGFNEKPFNPLIIGLTMERTALYKRIDTRVEMEIAKGLVGETRELLTKGYKRDLVSMKSLGYRQIAGFLEGEYSFEEAVRCLKRDTRHFSKRQMTWFRKESQVDWLEVQPDESTDSVKNRIMSCVSMFVKDLVSDIKPPADESGEISGYERSSSVVAK